MKKILITLAIIILLPLKFSFGADKAGFVMLRSDDGLKLSAGVSTKILGLTNYSYVNLGKYSSISSEMGVSMKKGKLTLGLLAGPNVDFNNMGAEEFDVLLTYLTGAAGVTVGYDLSTDWGLVGYAKHKFELQETATYQNGYEAGLGFFVRL